MSNRDLSPAVVSSKQYAKHLRNLLKPRLNDFSSLEAHNIIARLQGAKDWNTFLARSGQGFGSCFSSSAPSDPVTLSNLPIFSELNNFLNKSVLPKIDECAESCGLKRSNTRLTTPLDEAKVVEEHGYPSCTLMHGEYVPAIEYDLSIEPIVQTSNRTGSKQQAKGDCSFRGKLVITRHSVYIHRSDIYLGFPGDAGEMAFRIASDPRVDTGDLIEVLIQEPSSSSRFPVDINLQGAFGMWGDATCLRLGRIEADEETMSVLWADLLRHFVKLSQIFKAYKKYAGKWHNEEATATFITSMGDILTDEPRYRQVSQYFYEFTVKKLQFKLHLGSDGPHITCGMDGVQLDRAQIIHVDDLAEYMLRPDKQITSGWHIAKYGDAGQIRISLANFTEADVKKLCKELGAIDNGLFQFNNHEGFERSHAFEGLKKWMRENPKFAREYKGKHSWYDAALGQISNR